MGLPTYPKEGANRLSLSPSAGICLGHAPWYDGGRRPEPALIPKELTAYFEGQRNHDLG